VPGEFTLAFYASFGDSFAAEALTHARFADRRVNESREFFRVHVDEVIEFLHALPNDPAYKAKAEVEEPELVMGGEHRAAAESVATPFAELFATFPDDGEGRELTAEERAKCRALEGSR
jgi:hypothetical protein